MARPGDQPDAPPASAPPSGGDAPPSPPAPPAYSGATEQVIPGVRVPADAVRFRYARSSGPGGQNVNKVNTKAELWLPVDALIGITPQALDRLREMAGKRLTAAGEIHLSSDSERSQEANREAVLARLRALLESAVREPKVRRKTKPSRASKRRRVESKRRRGAIKAGRKGAGGDA